MKASAFGVFSDIWAAAVVIWEILTLGATPYFDGKFTSTGLTASATLTDWEQNR